jgi:hypothetical protein
MQTAIKNSGLVLNGTYYSATELQELEDGAILDLVFYVMQEFQGPAYAKLDLVQEIITMSQEVI